MHRKLKNKKHGYPNQAMETPAVNDPAVAYPSEVVGVELYDEEGIRQYYTVDEYAENLRIAINQHYGYELIAK